MLHLAQLQPHSLELALVRVAIAERAEVVG